jgi:hypothetical protein
MAPHYICGDAARLSPGTTSTAVDPHSRTERETILASLQEVAAELNGVLDQLPDSQLAEAMSAAENAQTMLQGTMSAMEEFIGQVDRILNAAGPAANITGPTRQALLKVSDGVAAFEQAKLAISDAIVLVGAAQDAGTSAVSSIAAGNFS